MIEPISQQRIPPSRYSATTTDCPGKCTLVDVRQEFAGIDKHCVSTGRFDDRYTALDQFVAEELHLLGAELEVAFVERLVNSARDGFKITSSQIRRKCGNPRSGSSDS